jgi:hypothetical protein
MIRFGLRLAVAGGTEAITRLALIAVAVAIGVGLLLTTLGSLNAFTAQNERYAWLETGYSGAEQPADTSSSDESVAVDPLWWLLRGDYFQGELIGRVDVAATGPDAPVPPGIAALPGPGEFYASPELSKLLAATPAAQLADRFPGTQVGIIGAEALPAPDTLIIIIGRDVADLSEHDGARQVTQISTTSPSDCSGECAPVGTDAAGMTMVLSVVAAALLFPVLVFIGGATRLSAARREQRFAAMRLVGATARQIATIATVESSVATIAGTVVGFGLFYALRPVIATIPFSGERFFTGDLSLSPANVLFVAIGIPTAAALTARMALRRVNISPLGVTRRVTPRPPRPWRLVPVLAGVAWLGYLAYFSDIADSGSSTDQAYAYLLGVFLIMIGLLVAGPWLTMLGSRLTARHSERPAGLIAARRLGDNPQTAFRAISGVVLAVFLGSCAIGTITTVVAYNGGAAGDSANSTATLIHPVAHRETVPSPIPRISDTAIDELTSIPGVEGVTAIHVDTTPRSASASGFNPDVPSERLPYPVGYFVASCAEIVHTPALGHCPDGADIVAVLPHFGGGVIDSTAPMSDTTWPVADMSTAELSTLPVDTIVVGTDGSTAAVEQARTVLEDRYPTIDPPQTLSEHQARNSQTINRYQQLANVVLFTSLPIAGCSLAVNIAGGLAERRRPFSLLRLTGVPLATLRRVVNLEAAVPLLLGVAASACAGFAAAALFLRAQLHQTLQPPTLTYYLVIAAGVIASLAIIATTNPLLARITGPDTARNE